MYSVVNVQTASREREKSLREARSQWRQPQRHGIKHNCYGTQQGHKTGNKNEKPCPLCRRWWVTENRVHIETVASERSHFATGTICVPVGGLYFYAFVRACVCDRALYTDVCFLIHRNSPISSIQFSVSNLGQATLFRYFQTELVLFHIATNNQDETKCLIVTETFPVYTETDSSQQTRIPSKEVVENFS